VLLAVDRGELPERRLESWRKLQREARWIAGRTDARLRAEQRRQWKQIHQEVRRSGRIRP
jgi:ribosome biogenesis GTPase